MRRGFTLVDVLVTLAVMAILMGILLPSMSGVRETARQVICRSNIRQLGIGITQYAGAHRDKLPFSQAQADGKPFDTMVLRSDTYGAWDGLGLLFSEEFMPAPLIFYCPSHRGQHPFAAYSSRWAQGGGDITGNFQYRGNGPISIRSRSLLTDSLSALDPRVALLVDGLRSKGDYNHRIGANLFRADSSVAWFAAQNQSVASMLPDDSTTTPPMEEVWGILDNDK